MDETGRPRGCGGKRRGGGIGGPFGGAFSDRAGEDGEYHQSRNLMKNMDIGKRVLRESSTARGEDRSERRKAARSELFWRGGEVPRLAFASIAR